MPDTYTLLEKVVVGAGGATTVTFTSIPQTYTDLVVKISARTTAATTNLDVNIGLNGSTNGTDWKLIQGNGSAAYSAGTTNAVGRGGVIPAASTTANVFSNIDIYIPNYTGSTLKSYSSDTVMENNGTLSYNEFIAGVYNSTSPVTSIAFTVTSSNNFSQYTTFYLYGVAKLGVTPTSAPKATGGDRVVADGTYWYHVFTSSGTFTPKSSLSCDVLVVAGGGSGGWPYSGGGGAGGVIAFASQALSTAQTVTVGGGAAGAYNTGNGVQGSNSVFGSLTAAVGGGGGVGDSTVTTARNGGSGGGGHPYGRGNPSTDNAGGTATSGQGNAGGLGSPNGSSQDSGGGGGGAGAVGANATTTAAGAGGAGTNSVTNWGALSSVLTTTGLGVSGFIAGGGGGGTNGSNAGAGGSGGGGRGANNVGTQESEAGTANTGSGSGGGAAGAAPASPKNGGSGLVIIRYAK